MNNYVEQFARVNDPNDSYSIDDFNKEFNSIPFDVSGFANEFKFVNKSNNEDPTFASIEASGFDLRADLDEPITLDPFKRILVKTGLFFQIPRGFEIQVRPRSGLALKNGITVLNTPGTVDSDYRGEVGVILINLGEEPFVINNGDRIAQAVISQALGNSFFKLKKVTEIDNNTERNESGFGSTGLK